MTTNKTKRIPISEIRYAIWAAGDSRRNHCYGGTHDEFIRCNVPLILERHLLKLSEILPLIPVRYTTEKGDCINGIQSCAEMIDKWRCEQTPESISCRFEINKVQNKPQQIVQLVARGDRSKIH